VVARLIDAVRGLFWEATPTPGQDPWVVAHDGELLLVQSVDGDRALAVRRCRDLDHLGEGPLVELWRPEGGDHAHQLWAPELHHLDGRWFVYVAASGGRNADHRSYALAGDHPLGPFTEAGRLEVPGVDRWAIDLTVLEHEGERFAVWSGWEGDGSAGDEPQHLYVAPMPTPTSLAGPRVRISSPELAWERTVFQVNEGPQVLRRPGDGALFLLYSADASWTHQYKLGVLEHLGGEVTDPAAWRKLAAPLLVGGGHGCVVEVDGGTELVFHRKTSPTAGWSDRVLAHRPLTWDAAGHPTLVRRRPPRSDALW
jgi:GH43 family beta-xylosidase